MEKNTTEAGGKRLCTKIFIQKILGKSPFTSAVIIFFIVISCLLLGFSKETIQRYEDIIIRKGQELFGTQEKIPCEDGWIFYKHDVIGISFCHPEEWGNVITEPKESVTRLDGLLDEFTSEENYYYNSFSIGFDKNESVSLRLFNESYGGERYPNSNAVRYGYVDNITDLKTSGDVCDYKMDFNYVWEQEGKINETCPICDEGIKTTIVDKQERFGKEVYSDMLESFAYLPLNNGYFNHVLSTYTYGSTVQLEQKFDNIDMFLSQVKRTKEDFEKEKASFTVFAKSFKAFVPEKKVQAAFETPSGEDARVIAIRKYYYLLEGGKFEEAYTMKAEDGKGTYEEFLSQYKDVNIAQPYDFKNIGGDDFYFLVRYQDHNKLETKYGIKMAIADGKIKTTFVEHFRGDEVTSGAYSAFAVERGKRSYLILKKGEVETIVDEGDAQYDSDFSNLDKVKRYTEIKFSPSGNYLLFTYTGYEWSASHIYNINSGKLSEGFLGSQVSDNFDVTPDEGYFFVCRPGGFDSTLPGEVYALPSVEKVFEAAPGNEAYVDSSCGYDADQKAVIFSLSSPYPEDTEPKSKEVKFEVNE
ncbi:MAG: hypothetical protein PHX30_02785 [Candidatus Pacebacteria bacterium]|nr:hypothetical protein [Candidatus Paceibacterota bacterium]